MRLMLDWPESTDYSIVFLCRPPAWAVQLRKKNPPFEQKRKNSENNKSTSRKNAYGKFVQNCESSFVQSFFKALKYSARLN
jgi:hypothetical protein